MVGMRKRLLSLLLCVMMVASLFAGTLTSASAADLGVGVNPSAAVIPGTGSANFTVSTMLDGILDPAQGDEPFDLAALVKDLMGQGLDLEAL